MPGRIAFAGDDYGEASYGARYPEKDWYGGFAPRLGTVYSLNDKTVLRGGWGIFYTQAFYPGWGGGSQPVRVLERSQALAVALVGFDPAMYLNEGFPIGNFYAAARHPFGLQERAGSSSLAR